MIADLHCHVIVPEMLTDRVPESWRPALGRADGRTLVTFRGTPVRSVTGEFTDVTAMLEQAAAQGVDHLLLSPWVMLIPVDAAPDEALRVCRVQNEGLAAAARDDRVSALAALPLQDAGLAARELERVMQVPGIKGAEIPSSVGGTYPGDPAFAPFWAAAADTGALIFIHPTTRGLGIPALGQHYLWNSVGNPLETTIAAAHLIAAGVLDRHPGLRILLAHGGGALPALRGRLGRAHAVRAEARAGAAGGPGESLRRLWFDSLTHDAGVLADLVAWAGADRVVLGSDRPFDMGADDPVADIRALQLGAGEDRILGGNAAGLLGLPDG
ncbi:MAG TPA: amidohydrolase family protein [Streptosporangiaceae bacterium]